MKNTTKTSTQVAVEFKRQELFDVKAAAKRAQAQLKKDVATLRYEMKELLLNVKMDKAGAKVVRKQAIVERKRVRAAVKAEKVAARVQKRGERVLAMSARLNEKSEKRAVRAAAKVARIAAMEAKLNALRNPSGTAAKKASKKPSKVTIIKNPAAALISVMNTGLRAAA